MVDLGGKLGNYRLIRLLGEGGFAKVYLGEHINLGIEAAIKVIKPRLNSVDIEQFHREAHTIAHLKHPHIVRILDFDVDDDTPFLVMDYVSGGTLRQRYPPGTRLPLKTILAHIKQVADALQYAHNYGFIHRDVKPENMLVGENDEVLLSDFGLAVVSRSTSTQSTQNQAGTFAYMAPEQIQGKPHKASDQYALGIIVYEWLCGALPFRGTWYEIVAQHLQAIPPPLHEKVPSISLEIEKVVLQALEKEYQKRFDSVQKFVTELEKAIQVAESLNERTSSSRLSSSEAASDSISLLQKFHDHFDAAVEKRQPIVPIPPATLSDQIPPTPVIPPHLNLPSVSSNPTISLNQPLPPPSGVSLLKQPISPSVTPLTSQTTLPLPRRRFLTSKTAILIGLVVMVIVGSGRLLTWQVTKYNADLQATATAHPYVIATAEARAAAQKYDDFVTAHGIIFGFDAQHTHNNPYEKVLSPTNVSKLVQDWSFPTRGPITSSPAVAHGVVYMGSWDGTLYALDVHFHKQLWSFKLGSQVVSSPTVANGIVYMLSWHGTLYALNAQSGSKLWNTPLGSDYTFSSSTMANKTVYIGSHGPGPLKALNDAGRFLWPKEWCPNNEEWWCALGSHCSDAQCRYIVVVGDWSSFGGGGLVAPPPPSPDKNISSSPAVANGVVYLGSWIGKLYASNAMGCGGTSCKPLWAADTGTITSSPVVANGVVYIGSDDGQLYTFDAKGCSSELCKPLWTFKTGGPIESSPAVANGVVYIGSDDGQLYAFNAKNCSSELCKPLWMFKTGGPIKSSPAVANGVVYIGSDDGQLYALDAQSGSKLWTFKTGGSIKSSPTVAYGVIFVGSDDGQLYAFHLPGTTP